MNVVEKLDFSIHGLIFFFPQKQTRSYELGAAKL